MPSAIFSTPGTTTWTAPSGIIGSTTFESWGAGGAGGIGIGTDGGGGGAGGNYHTATHSATAGQVFTVIVGAGGNTSGTPDGGVSAVTLSGVDVTRASGGPGASGLSGGSTDFTFGTTFGGDGGNSRLTGLGGGGGGGGGAINSGTDGLPGADGNGGVGGGGGIFGGGTGGSVGFGGDSGISPGGGGGGDGGSFGAAGPGGDGQVIITWTVGTIFTKSVTSTTNRALVGQGTAGRIDGKQRTPSFPTSSSTLGGRVGVRARADVISPTSSLSPHLSARARVSVTLAESGTISKTKGISLLSTSPGTGTPWASTFLRSLSDTRTPSIANPISVRTRVFASPSPSSMSPQSGLSPSLNTRLSFSFSSPWSSTLTAVKGAASLTFSVTSTAARHLGAQLRLSKLVTVATDLTPASSHTVKTQASDQFAAVLPLSTVDIWRMGRAMATAAGGGQTTDQTQTMGQTHTPAIPSPSSSFLRSTAKTQSVTSAPTSTLFSLFHAAVHYVLSFLTSTATFQGLAVVARSLPIPGRARAGDRRTGKGGVGDRPTGGGTVGDE